MKNQFKYEDVKKMFDSIEKEYNPLISSLNLKSGDILFYKEGHSYIHCSIILNSFAVSDVSSRKFSGECTKILYRSGSRIVSRV